MKKAELKVLYMQLAEKNSGWRSKRVGRAGALLIRERFIGRGQLAGC